MLEYFKQLLQNQFDASLCMLADCVSQCPEEHWEGRIGNSPFWRVAYHTAYFVDMYLSADELAFQPHNSYRENIHNLGESDSTEDPYAKEVVVEYIEHCRTKAAQVIAIETPETLESPSGFPWYPMSRGEHHLTSIRHIQHHAGQLSAYLIKYTGQGANWIGKPK